MKTSFLFLVASISIRSLYATGWPVIDVAELAFQQLKWSAEEAKWADELRTLADTLQFTQRQLEAINYVRSAIGDPKAVVGGYIDAYTFSNLLDSNNIPNTLWDIQRLNARGLNVSETLQALYGDAEIDIERYVQSNSYTGMSTFRDPQDPLKRYRAIENAYTEYEKYLDGVQKKRATLNEQIDKLNSQLKGTQTDAEVQKLHASLLASQTALASVDQMEADSAARLKVLIALNDNREKMEQVAYAEINRRLDEKAAEDSAKARSAILNSK